MDRLELNHFDREVSARTFHHLALSGSINIIHTKMWESILATTCRWIQNRPILDEGKPLCAGRVICSIYRKLNGSKPLKPEKVQEDYLKGKPFPFKVTKLDYIKREEIPLVLIKYPSDLMMLFLGTLGPETSHVVEVGPNFFHDPSRERVECDSHSRLMIKLAAYLLTAYPHYTEARLYVCGNSSIPTRTANANHG